MAALGRLSLIDTAELFQAAEWTSQGRKSLALVDEIIPVRVLFGSGTLLFENLGLNQTQLDGLDVVNTPNAVHLRFAIRK